MQNQSLHWFCIRTLALMQMRCFDCEFCTMSNSALPLFTDCTCPSGFLTMIPTTSLLLANEFVNNIGMLHDK